jgi:uncharacterized membrane protein YgdD (TMEM256/DUF423 family)
MVPSRMDRSRNIWIAAGAANGLIAVAMGAFAAHGLKNAISDEALGWVRTGAEYQMWHGLALLALAALGRGSAGRASAIAGIAFLAGAILFSGSLYLLAFTGWRGFALVTPLGGTAFLVGWAVLVWSGFAGRGGG